MQVIYWVLESVFSFLSEAFTPNDSDVCPFWLWPRTSASAAAASRELSSPSGSSNRRSWRELDAQQKETSTYLVQFGPTLELFFDFWSFFDGFGVREWSKNAPGTRTIIFPVSIPHIIHSRPISNQFWPFRPSPIVCISARQRIFFFCNKKIQSKSFISPLWWIRFALGHEKSVESYPNHSHRNSESSIWFEKWRNRRTPPLRAYEYFCQK